MNSRFSILNLFGRTRKNTPSDRKNTPVQKLDLGLNLNSQTYTDSGEDEYYSAISTSSPKSDSKLKSNSASKLKTNSASKLKTNSASKLKTKSASKLKTNSASKLKTKSASKLNIENIGKNCSTIGICIALGRYSDDIKELFDFENFNNIDKEQYHPIQKITTKSNNGFINQIYYSVDIKRLLNETEVDDEDEYKAKAFAILKSAQSKKADNLLYEFLVGEFINIQNKRFPCFVETYGLYKYINDETWKQMQKKYNEEIYKGTPLLGPETITKLSWNDYVTACSDSKYLALLIQHLDGLKTLDDKLSELNFKNKELLYVLFQIYVPLSLLKDNFTHYDLHLKNVVLYTPMEGKYIEYHYHLSETNVIVFKSQYIAKIIDYGRCYFKDEKSDIDSQLIYEALCKVKECNIEKDSCGYNQGFHWLNLKPNEHYINSQIPNMSHDLWLLHIIKQQKPDLPYMLTNVVYKKKTGTPAVTEKGLPSEKINNVQDAADFFISEVQTADAKTENEAFYKRFKSLGKLHIYCNEKDKPMEFIPNDN